MSITAREPPTLRDLSLDDLRILRQRLTDEEGLVSYWRRLFQARLDMLSDTPDIAGLEPVLHDAYAAPRRWQALGMHPAHVDDAMPEAQALWQRVVDTDDGEALAAYVKLLKRMEQSLSANRKALHQQIDVVTAELIARYRTNPALVLTALPTRRNSA